MTFHPDLVVGLHLADDAGVFRMSDGTLLLQTVDYFTPVVDDAFDWGRIAASNALSDIYAMGGTPLTAMQLIGWPRGKLSFGILDDVIAGGVEILQQAGCVLIGGHSVDDPEPKYGFAVSGTVEEKNLVMNRGAQPGDALVLTKPLGIGVIATALKAGRAPEDVISEAVSMMVTLNDGAARAMNRVGVHAGTDVTGFGLLGHLSEMLVASKVGARIRATDVPLMGGLRPLAEAGLFSGGSGRNLDAVRPALVVEGVDDTSIRILADAQTSGGLLMAVALERLDAMLDALAEERTPAAAVIGEIVEDDHASIVVTRS
ncbi:selenide, water dikinase [bacterium BMS3Abin02]|nr:selenide, water dikinase [bacterium BMS3Abin02]GBE21478.1 selenide, water dikinase [bacterium BMS3Bbin01]